MIAKIHDNQQEAVRRTAKRLKVRPPRTMPDRSTRRPIQPVRPAESVRPGLGLLATKARRRRYRGMKPPMA